ncbi:hypothetical protein R3P38DRAFT_3023579 [Favolaschia claudopus]|uniref:Uncharacterized protein n=1 Tax=Favolaschia claudopus TaxID=2862362 RepID=A0AAW0AHA6_9AGAR
MIVAISVASVFVVIASALTLFFCWRRRRRRTALNEREGRLSASPYPFALAAAPQPSNGKLDFVNPGTLASSSSSATLAFRRDPLLSSSQSQSHSQSWQSRSRPQHQSQNFSERSTDVDTEGTLHRQPTILSSVSHSSSATRGSLYPTFVTGYDNPRSARIAEYLAQLPPVSSQVLEEEDGSSAGGSKGKEREGSLEPP